MTVSGYFSHFKLAFDACWNSQAVDGTRLIADSESSFSPSYYSHLVCASTYARFGLSFPAINTAPKPEVDWDEAFRLNYVHLRSLAIKIVGPNDAEDAVQTAFLNAVRTNNFAGRSSLRTWLYRLTINSCLMMLRKRNRKCEFVVCELPDRVSLDPSPLEICRDAERLIRVSRALRRINPTAQTVVHLHLHGYEFGEIAELHGTPAGTTKARYFRAMRTVREHVGQE